MVTQFFLSLTDLLGESGTFGLFAFMLDEIQQMWVTRNEKSLPGGA